MTKDDQSLKSETGWEFQPGQVVFGKFRIKRYLGAGAMGCVYEAEHIDLLREVALKVLSTNHSAMRFQQEARTASALKHKNIASVLDFGSMNNRLYMSLELVNGTTLQEMLQGEERLSIDVAVEIITQVLSALEYAHQERIVHRDIKPGNIMVTRSGTEIEVKVLDFGIAKRLTNDSGSIDLTRPGAIVGSPLYISPEQIVGEDITDKADIYSLGCVLFESLTGRPPFIGESALETMLLHQNEPAPRLSDELDADIRNPLDELIELLLAKDPNRRPSAGDARRRLEQLSEGPSIGAPLAVAKVNSESRTGRSIWIILLAIPVFLIGGVVGAWIVSPVGTPETVVKPAEESERELLRERIAQGLARHEKEYNLSKWDLKDEDLVELSSLKDISRLAIHLPHETTDQGIAYLTNLKVESLNLSESNVESLEHLDTLKSLRVLKLNDTKIKNSSLDSLASLRKLEKLYLDRCPNISISRVCALMKEIPSLVTLQCDQLSEPDCVRLRQSYPSCEFNDRSRVGQAQASAKRLLAETNFEVGRKLKASVDVLKFDAASFDAYVVESLSRGQELCGSGRLDDGIKMILRTAEEVNNSNYRNSHLSQCLLTLFDATRVRRSSIFRVQCKRWMPIVDNVYGPNSREMAALLARKGDFLRESRQFDEAIAVYKRCRQITEQLTDPQPEWTQAIIGLGACYDNKKELSRSISLFKEGLARSDKRVPPMLVAEMNRFLGVAYTTANQPELAERHLQKALTYYTSKNDPTYIAEALYRIGVSYNVRHQPAEAHDYFLKAVRHFEAVRPEPIDRVAATYRDLANMSSERERYAEAMNYFSRSNAAVARLTDRVTRERQQSANLYHIGMSLTRQQKPQESNNFFDEYLKLDPNADSSGVAYVMTAENSLKLNKNKDALRRFKSGLNHFQSHKEPKHESDILERIGNLYFQRLKDIKSAMKYYKECVALRERLFGHNALNTVQARVHVAKCEFHLGQREVASELFNQCLKRISSDGSVDGRWNRAWILLYQSRFAQDRHERKEALALIRRALKLCADDWDVTVELRADEKSILSQK